MGGKTMDYYREKKETVLRAFGTNEKTGLETSRIPHLLAKYGENSIQKAKKASFLRKFLSQFSDVMILILLGAAAISFALAFINGESSEFVEPVLILSIVTVNAILGVFQENKAEKALEALENLSSPHANVLRDGGMLRIDAAKLVPGDILFLEAGDFVPADARLLSAVSLRTEESALTGESMPVEKHPDIVQSKEVPLGDRVNMIFAGSSVSYGSCCAVVTATGMDTEMGKIAAMLSDDQKTETPLQKKLADLGSLLGIAALVACGVIFVIGRMSGIPLLEIFMTSVSLAVSAIPEGLPAIVTVVLSIGVERMAKRGALIRHLPAVETLGSASVICSDKTGTLTQNRMTLTECFADGMQKSETLSRYVSERSRRVLQYAAMCCDAKFQMKDGKEYAIGDPSECAILFAAKHNYAITEDLQRIGEIPFDSDRKRMTTVYKKGSGALVIVKGAFDVLEKHCTSGNLAKAKMIADDMSARALRVLGVGFKELSYVPKTKDIRADILETDLTFLGLVGMIDPPRKEAKDAVKICKKAGIRPVMITGDHILTASAIASELGILEKNGTAITGHELDRMSDEQLKYEIEHISVFARVSPENKLRIVKILQSKGHVVAMTGDGVNDAPALKAADIGCAMGLSGTDVAKAAADMTLTDDNFATIVAAVKEGRGIYANIRKVVGFLLGTNIGEVLTVFFAMLLWRKTPLVSMQLLWINLVTDGLPAIALGMEKVEADCMLQKPKPKSEGIFSHGLGFRVMISGLIFAGLSLIAFCIGEFFGGTIEGGRTLAFFVLSLMQIVEAFNMRSERSLFEIGIFSNKKMNSAAFVSVLLVTLVMFTPLCTAFGLVLLPWKAYFYGICLILTPLFLGEVRKSFLCKKR